MRLIEIEEYRDNAVYFLYPVIFTSLITTASVPKNIPFKFHR